MWRIEQQSFTIFLLWIYEKIIIFSTHFLAAGDLLAADLAAGLLAAAFLAAGLLAALAGLLAALAAGLLAALAAGLLVTLDLAAAFAITVNKS